MVSSGVPPAALIGRINMMYRHECSEGGDFWFQTGNYPVCTFCWKEGSDLPVTETDDRDEPDDDE